MSDAKTDEASIVGRSFEDRVGAADWLAVADEVNEYGSALLPRLLTPPECAELAASYDEPERFRATIDMARYRFGRGGVSILCCAVSGAVATAPEGAV